MQNYKNYVIIENIQPLIKAKFSFSQSPLSPKFSCSELGWS